jgi:GNAT superfamily N-acetyltransferase
VNVTFGSEAKHAPDASPVVEVKSSVARCSCWWRATPEQLGFIGHYEAANAEAGTAVLAKACGILARAGCTSAVGPVEGNTWRRYRFVVDRGSEPPFFLEPDNPDDWPEHWSSAGFSHASTYASALNEDLTIEDPRTAGALVRLAADGISIRPFDAVRSDAELRRIFALTTVAFRNNFLYAPIAEEEFLTQNRALLRLVRPELTLLAERHGRLVGYLFAVPDLVETQRRGISATVILKTIAVDPSVSGMGLGGVLMDLVQRSARRLGFRRAIHALMHERNASRNISRRYASTIRRYALLGRQI